MKIGVPKETADGERRVALVPDAVASLKKNEKLSIAVERGAGEAAGHPDSQYEEAGADVVDADVTWGADVVLRVAVPSVSDIGRLNSNQVLISHLAPWTSAETNNALAQAGVERVDPAAAEIARVESGRPRFGREMTTETIPQEAGINERAVSFSKGCYIGQETVARLHYRGKPNRHLRGLRLAEPVADGAPIRLGERELGRVGTAVLSPAHGPIALAIVRREAEPGAKVEIESDGGTIEAAVVDLPFV